METELVFCMIGGGIQQKKLHEHIAYSTDGNPDPETSTLYPRRLYRCKEDESRYYIIHHGDSSSLRSFIKSYTKQLHNLHGIKFFPVYSASQPI